MKEKVYLIGISLFLTAFWGCQEQDTTESNNGSVTVDLAFSVSHVTRETRQGLDVVQAENQPFRGLKDLWIIPFHTDGDNVTANDAPYIEPLVGSNVGDNRVGEKYYYYLGNYSMMTGADHVLVYGRAPQGDLSNAANGKLETTLSGNRMLPKDITFSLRPIISDATNLVQGKENVHEDAQALAYYMTTIAGTSGWSTTNNSELKGLYLDFIRADGEGAGLLCGSANHIKAYVGKLKEALESLKTSFAEGTEEYNLCDAIITNIGNLENTEAAVNNGYPASIGLPDGAAVIRWTGGNFQVSTTTTTLDNINGITRYTYPAELWYMVDSPIRTSSKEVPKTTYASNNETWEAFLNTNYKDSPSVHGGTQSVAVEKSLQYGVGQLEMTLNPLPESLKDAKDDDVPGNQLPLKGVIIGGQHIVGFDFKPRGEQSDVDASFIYDSEIGTTGTVNTLVLQSFDNEKIPIVLEFENDTDPFVGRDGIVYPGTKFYLIGMIDPAGEYVEGKDYTLRVFTQDYITKTTLSVVSLANAYTCMPDLLQARLELGVQVQTKWIQSTTSTVRL